MLGTADGDAFCSAVGDSAIACGAESPWDGAVLGTSDGDAFSSADGERISTGDESPWEGWDDGAAPNADGTKDGLLTCSFSSKLGTDEGNDSTGLAAGEFATGEESAWEGFEESDGAPLELGIPDGTDPSTGLAAGAESATGEESPSEGFALTDGKVCLLGTDDKDGPRDSDGLNDGLSEMDGVVVVGGSVANEVLNSVVSDPVKVAVDCRITSPAKESEYSPSSFNPFASISVKLKSLPMGMQKSCKNSLSLSYVN